MSGYMDDAAAAELARILADRFPIFGGTHARFGSFTRALAEMNLGMTGSLPTWQHTAATMAAWAGFIGDSMPAIAGHLPDMYQWGADIRVVFDDLEEGEDDQ